MKTIKVKIELNEMLLGTASANPEIHREFIASKAPDAKSVEDEVACIGVEESIEKAMTVFPQEDGNPFLYDYQIKGFFKDACGMLSRVPDTLSKNLKAYKKTIDGLVFVTPRKIMLQLPNGAKLTNCQRPLRAQTAQGERIALANSEAAPAGTVLEFSVNLLDGRLDKLVTEWLEYGQLRGLGQWRNSGMGRFTVKSMEQD